MNRLEKVAISTAAISTLLGAVGFQSFPYQYYVDQMLPGSLPIAATGWAIATYGPIALAVIFWRCAKVVRPPFTLVLHVLFLPCALTAFWAGERLMLALISDLDFDATLSAPEMPAILSLAVAIICYFAAVIVHRTSASAAGGRP